MTIEELTKAVRDKQAPKTLLDKRRIAICNTCDTLHKPTRMCSACFCFVDLKTKILSQSCPKQKW